MVFLNPTDFVTKHLSETGYFPPLDSNKIYELADLFIQLRSRIIWERQTIESGGVTEAEYPGWSESYSLEGKLDTIINQLNAIALTTLINMDLEQFNKEILDSTKRLIQAAEQLKQIRDNIRKFVVIVDDVLAIVAKLSTGGTFEVVGIFDEVTKLLAELGLNLPTLF